MKNTYEKLATYEQIKEIVENTERLRHEKHRECLDNGWMSDMTEHLVNIKIEAYEQIKELAKD